MNLLGEYFADLILLLHAFKYMIQKGMLEELKILPLDFEEFLDRIEQQNPIGKNKILFKAKMSALRMGLSYLIELISEDDLDYAMKIIDDCKKLVEKMKNFLN